MKTKLTCADCKQSGHRNKFSGFCKLNSTGRTINPDSPHRGTGVRGRGGRGRGRGNFNSSNATESSETAGSDEGDLSHFPDHIKKLIEDYRKMSDRQENQDTSEQESGENF